MERYHIGTDDRPGKFMQSGELPVCGDVTETSLSNNWFLGNQKRAAKEAAKNKHQLQTAVKR